MDVAPAAAAAAANESLIFGTTGLITEGIYEW
jgi:hypothetical protein